MKRAEANLLWSTACVLARDAAAVSRPDSGRDLPPLLFFTDPDRTPRPWEIADRLPPGAGVVFRGFGDDGSLATARRLRDVTALRGLRLLIGQDADLAERVDADGVHLPERMLGKAGRLAVSNPRWLVTGAVHSIDAVRKAENLDALVVSPVFRAGGASAGRPPIGLTTFSSWVGEACLPVYALGGIGPETAGTLVGTGACGIAAVDAVVSAFGGERA